MLHLVLWSQSSHRMWCCRCRTACGVAGVAPRAVLRASNHAVSWASHSGWCCGRRTAGGVAGIAPRVVSRASRHVWCCRRCTACNIAVTVIAPCCVAVVVTVVAPRGAAVAITVVAVIAVGGWAMEGPGGGGQLRVRRRAGRWGSLGIGQQKRKLAKKKKKEKKKDAPTRVSQCE